MGLSVYTPSGNKIVHNVNVDFVLRYTEEPVHVVQYDDKLPVLAVKLYRNGNPYSVFGAETVSIRYRKPDGTFVYNPALGVDSSRGTVYFEVTQQMTAVPGKARLTVELEDQDGTACSGAAMLEIDRNPVQEGDVESTVEFQALGQRVEEEVAEQGQEIREELAGALKNKQDYFSSTIDLSGSEYDRSKYYPVTGTVIPEDGMHLIKVCAHLGSGVVPSWATNAQGFESGLEILDSKNGYGMCLNSYALYVNGNTNPAGYLQMRASGTPVVSLRGGGKYFVYTDFGCGWTVRTDPYTVSGETVRPIGTRTLRLEKAVIMADLSGDVKGNVDGTLNGFTLAKSVPADAKFTDTVYTHPATPGNKHIPSGGSAGQILRWGSAGTAVWGDEMNSDAVKAAEEVAAMVLAVTTETVTPTAHKGSLWGEGGNYANLVNGDAGGPYAEAAELEVSPGERYLVSASTSDYYSAYPCILLVSGAELMGYPVEGRYSTPLTSGGSEYLVEIPESDTQVSRLLVNSSSEDGEEAAAIKVRRIRV